jgi:ATP-binding cassette subfamily B (MDR/TAP) protein 1
MADETNGRAQFESRTTSHDKSFQNGNSVAVDTEKFLNPSECEKGKDGDLISPWKAYLGIWKYSSNLDMTLRVLGACAALGAGTAAPLMTIVFGNLINEFNQIELGSISPAQFRAAVDRNALWFVYLFVGKFMVRHFISSTSAIYVVVPRAGFNSL